MASEHLSEDESHSDLSIFLLGKTGSGKSRTGNSILGKPLLFKFGIQTDACSVETIENRLEKTIHVIDTPSNISTAPNVKQIQELMNQYQAYENYKRCFGDRIFENALVIFTCYDKWENDMDDSQIENPDFKSYIKSLSDQNQKLLHLCGHRWVAFNNRLKGTDNDVQVNNLFEIIDDILKLRTCNQPFWKRIFFSPKIEEAGTVPQFQKPNQMKEGQIQNNGTTESGPKDCELQRTVGSCRRRTGNSIPDDEKDVFSKCNII